MRLRPHSKAFIFLTSIWLLSCSDTETRGPATGSTEFTSEVPAGTGNESTNGLGNRQGTSTANPSFAPPIGVSDNAAKAAPGGRVAEVKEADVYRISDNKLYLLNTYRGFMVFDITDVKTPVRVSTLPVYGYPVEMFVEGTTVYALLSDALYLTQVDGKVQFERRNVSQIVSIDISNPAAPKVLQTYDLAGQLREGVSRKIDNTLYVVSYRPSGYWFYGWGRMPTEPPQEKAFIYSFDTRDPANLKQVQELNVFEGGRTSSYDPITGESHERYSNGVTLSATSNAIMVVQNWQTSDYVPPQVPMVSADAGTKRISCGYSRSDQESIVTVVDVSDPVGSIELAAKFTTPGSLGDQFKQTYVYDEATQTGTYYGIFSRNVWAGDACQSTSYTQNTVESWNIGGPLGVKKLTSLNIGKPNELVRGSTFDVDRKVIYAITAESMDPLYAIGFQDRSNLKTLSSIDGLTGDMNLFRQVEGGNFLLAVGRDTGNACGKNNTNWNNQVAVTLVDVRDVSKIRIVERKCLDLTNAGWVNSAVNWNLDQAHKMIGLSTDGQVNVLTIPVSYSVQDGASDGWWYRYETAVGIMSWDLSKYDDTKPATLQRVLSTHGRFVHPEGEVQRSVLFPHAQGRSMLNISDTHLSFADIQNLDNPTLNAVVPLAENIVQVFRFGDHLVEQILISNNSYAQGVYEFRVKKAGGDLEKASGVASFKVGNLNQVLRHGNLLVLSRTEGANAPKPVMGEPVSHKNLLTVYDLSVPSLPKRLATIDIPDDYALGFSPYGYYCGGFYPGYYFSSQRSQVNVDAGIVFLSQTWHETLKSPERVAANGDWIPPEYLYETRQYLTFLDLRNPAAPKFSRQQIQLVPQDSSASDANLVVDPTSPSGFYISFWMNAGMKKVGETTLNVIKYRAQRFDRQGATWQSEPAFSLPGQLTRVFPGGAGERLLLSMENIYMNIAKDGGWNYEERHTLHLLRAGSVNGKPVAELLASHPLGAAYPRSMVFDGSKAFLMLSERSNYYPWIGTEGARVGGVGIAADSILPVADTVSDRLLILDASANTLSVVYDQRTGLTNLELMGVNQNRLFMNLTGDGILVLNVANAASPQAVTFYRTLGYVSGVEFTDTTAYFPASYYGVYQMDLNAPSTF